MAVSVAGQMPYLGSSLKNTGLMGMIRNVIAPAMEAAREKRLKANLDEARQQGYVLLAADM